MSGHHQHRYNEEDLAYGDQYDGSRGYGQQPQYDQYGQYSQQQGQEGQDRGIIGDTFKKFKSKYDQYQGQRPSSQDPYGYGGNPSSSTVGSQAPGGGSGYAGNQYQPSGQNVQPGQSDYQGGPGSQQSQRKPGKPGFADRIVGDLIGSVTSIGSDVNKMFGSPKPPQGQSQYPGQQAGLQTNLQTQVASGPTSHRYNSTFAGPKPGNDVKWYVDGCSYMWAVSEALEHARQSIWILDWWLSPELYLRRPPAKNEEWRVDKVLQRAANRGVKVNIIVYKEVTQVLTLSSAHTKHALENLSPNIAVFRHPDHLPDAQTAHSSILSSLQGLTLDAAGASKLGSDALKGLYGITDDVILYWAHHEKLCLIDGATAFMGGLDLCFGRWDTNQHPISDAHPSDLNKIVFPGQDYNNARVMDFSDVSQPFQNKLDRTKSSRMGWSDISISLRGPCVGDLIHHFVDRWNLIYDEKYNVRKDARYSRLPPYPEHRDDEIPVSAEDAQAQAGQTQGQLSGQFTQSQYTPPPWQGGQQQGSNVANPSSPLPQSGQQYGQQDVYSAQHQTQQTFPPPPPGPPPTNQGQYQQTAQTGQFGQNVSDSHYSQTQQTGLAYAAGSATSQQGNVHDQQYQQSQGQHSAHPPRESTDLYGSGQTQQPYPSSPATQQTGQFGEQHQHQPQPYAQNVPTPANTGYNTQAQQQAYPQPAGAQTTPYSSAPHHQDQYSSPNPNTSYTQPQSSVAPPAPVFSPPPQQGQQTQAQRPVSPMDPAQTQLAQHQYAAYTSVPDPGLPAGSQGPAELATSQSPQYRPYQGEPTARGFDDSQGYSGERGFNEGYEHEYGQDRAFGSNKTNRPAGQGRFDRYKDEARKFKDEGKFLGHDLREYGNRIENKLDNKMAHYSGGRIGVGRSVGNMSCQLVRSCTKWSNGTPTEHSVQNAYIELIQKSKHFIYIENQFFITATGDKQKPVKNMIGAALVERVVRASREDTPFKVMVNIPSVPAFAGDLVEDGALGTRAIMKYQYNSICRGGFSIMEEIQKAGVNPMDYIRFYNLRNYDRINVTPSMQQAQQQTGVGYDDARRQYESQLGSGYGGYGETRAPTDLPGQTGQPGQPGQYTQPGQVGATGQYAQTGQPGQYNQTNQPGQTGQYSQAQSQPGQYTPTTQSGQAGQYNQPGQYGQYAQSGQSGQTGYNSQQTGQPSFPPPPTQPYQQSQTGQSGGQSGGYGAQQSSSTTAQTQGYGSQQPPAYTQYQQAAHAAPTVKADDWDTVSSCYMLGGQDIRTVPWAGPAEEELNAFVSEELYIHSKVMIVDDQTVVCGSANLNDRSMLGSHDSEIAMIIQDQTMVESRMAGRPWQASRFGASLRRQLFRKHLGLIRPQDYHRPDDNSMPVGVPNVYDWGSPEDHIVSDPLSDAFQSLWNSRARTNTEVYRRAFRAVPDDNVRTWTAYKEFFEYYFKKADAQAVGKDEKARPSRVEYGHVVASDFPGGVRELKELLSQVKGTVVEMPLCFLADEDIAKENFTSSFNALTNEVYT